MKSSLWLSLLKLPIVLCTSSPVILVPGTAGNQLEAELFNKHHKPWYCSTSTESYFALWLDIFSLLPFKINCWVDNARLEWDMSKMTASNTQGVTTRVPGFGDTTTMETLDAHGLVKYMKYIVDHLIALGYHIGKDLHGAPYDFRHSPETLPHDYHGRLKTLIEGTYKNNINKPVTIISHSYGCIVTQYFLSLQTAEWKKKYVNQWIPLAGPFGGSKIQLHVYSSGHLEGQLNYLVNRLTLRKFQRPNTSNLYMLPSSLAWASNDIIAKTQNGTYTIADLDEFLRNVGFPDGVKMRQHITNSSELMTKAPGVPIHCFYGHIAASTIDYLVFGSSGFPDDPQSVVNGDGDGSVNAASLRLCRNFTQIQDEPVNVNEIPGVDHTGILQHEEVFSAISKLLK